MSHPGNTLRTRAAPGSPGSRCPCFCHFSYPRGVVYWEGAVKVLLEAPTDTSRLTAEKLLSVSALLKKLRATRATHP